ncbi:DUF7694 domain-containing protein [Pseudophaeobacter arcticus]|uniref:DUF7694 domain-containing protein n=1 Tax=Pseudophaeobacter arcticus TaxID=385492 RepID=UPI00248F5FDC|nr:hypothetical protein [Pseudophaeobacter arcticus]
MRTEPETELFEAFGFPVEVDQNLGHLWVIHDGSISWDQLQEIKNQAWGADARAIEVYPAKKDVVNSLDCRHLWRLGPNDFAPDLLGNDPARDSLAARYMTAWAEAREDGHGS